MSGLYEMQGLHLTADLYGCRSDPELLIDAARLATLCHDSVRAAGLTVVNDKFHTFPPFQGQPGGVTGAVLLAESHLALHTWPERQGVTLDVYVCNFSTDNSAKAERLMDDLIVALKPEHSNTQRILRGSANPVDMTDELLLEWLNSHSAFGYRAHRRLETKRTAHQTVEVFDTPQWGKLFRLDGWYMTSERDEFFYHEPLIHPAAICHPAPRSALVIGGGDGGSSEELLKHPSMQRVVMAELDAEVIEVAKRHLAQVHRGVFDDPRLTVVIGDGYQHVQQSNEKFDLIVLDLTDPETPAHRLYTPEFFKLAKLRLNPGGALTLHIGSPIYQQERVAGMIAALRQAFEIVRPLGLYVPLYGAYWGMAVASDTMDPVAVSSSGVEARLAQRSVADLQYYNGDVHQALFALPNFYRKLASPRTDGAQQR